MALGNNAYTMLQAEQQARADQLAALQASPTDNMRRAGVIGKNLGSAANTVYRAFDPFNPVVAARDMYDSGVAFKDSVGDLAKVAGPQVGGFLANMGRDVMNRIDADAGLSTPQRQMVPVPSRNQILNPAPALSPQPDVMGAQVFGPAAAQAAAPQAAMPQAAMPPAAMPQAAIAAEALEKVNAEDEAEKPAQRSRQPARPAIPPTPQQRQEAMAQAFASPETLQAVAEATTAPDGKGEPIKKKRKGFTPENMGLIAFGLTLMSGGDFDDALNNGLALHGTLDGMRDEKEQKAASEELLKSVPPEYVPALNALIASKQFDKVAEYGLGIQQDEAAAEAANAQRLGLVQQAASVLGVSPDAISMMPADKLAQMVVNRFDTQDTMQINAQKAQIEASKQAALDGDEGEARAYLAQFGVDAEMLSGKALEK